MIQELIKYYQLNGSVILKQFFRHALISVYGVIFAAIVAIPLGFYLTKNKKLSNWVMSFANIIQTIPSLALLSILMVFFGLGPNSVIAAVFLYSLLPILKNTYTAVRNIDKDIIDVVKGMGMSSRQIIFKVQLPLSLSLILGGIRNAIVVAVGITAIGTFIGAGGLGDIISRGINVSDGSAIIWAGAIPTALLAVGADFILSLIEKRLDLTR